MSETNPIDPAPASNSGDDSTSVARQSIEGIFVEALGKSSPDERRAFLDMACEGNPDSRRRVDALLAAYDDAGSFLQHPAGDWKSPPGAAAAPVDPQGIPIGLLQPSDKPGCLGTLGTYEVQQFLGRGGMGIVLRALDPQLNRIVAIKVLAPELAVDVSSRRRFLREARAAAAVSHPHVVTIHAVAVDDDRLPYLVMECIVGRSLQQKIDQTGPLKMKEILRIGTQIAEGLAAAHKQGLVHRDIKPANILLENGVERVKITDFGLARSVDDAGITRTGEVSGTPQYMSPEQALGQHVDHRSDLFSLGCVLYAMCAGRPPFRGDNVAVVVKRICDDAPRPISEINPEIPGWLIQTIEHLLAKDPAQRFQSATEVADILSGQLAHAQQPHAGHVRPIPGLAPRPAPVEQIAKFLQVLAGPAKPVSNWLLVVAIAIAGVLFGRATRFESLEGKGPLFPLLLVLGSTAIMVKHGVAARWHKLRIAGWIAGSAFVSLTAILYGGKIGSPEFRPSDLLLFGLGIGYLVYVVQRGVIPTAGMVADTADPADVQTAMPAGEQAHPSAAQPWNMAGWMVVAVLSFVLLIPCVIGVGLLVPWLAYRSAESEIGSLTIEYDNTKAPLQEIRLRGGNLPAERVFPVDSMPFRIGLAPGQYELNGTKMLYEDSGQRLVNMPTLSFTVEKKKETRLILKTEPAGLK